MIILTNLTSFGRLFCPVSSKLDTVCCKGKGRQLAKSQEKEVNERALQLLDAMSTVQRGGMSGTLSAFHPTSVKFIALV